MTWADVWRFAVVAGHGVAVKIGNEVTLLRHIFNNESLWQISKFYRGRSGTTAYNVEMDRRSSVCMLSTVHL